MGRALAIVGVALLPGVGAVFTVKAGERMAPPTVASRPRERPPELVATFVSDGADPGWLLRSP